jgi:hypothetical protein
MRRKLHKMQWEEKPSDVQHRTGVFIEMPPVCETFDRTNVIGGKYFYSGHRQHGEFIYGQVHESKAHVILVGSVPAIPR